jgi:hypothetical protein
MNTTLRSPARSAAEEFMLQPNGLISSKSEVRAASPSGHDVEEQAAMTGNRECLRQPLFSEYLVENVKNAALAVMVARQNVQRGA